MKTLNRKSFNNYSGVLLNILIAATLILLTSYSLYKGVSDDKILMEGFKGTGAHLKNTEISSWGKISSQFTTKKKLVDAAKRVSMKFTSSDKLNIKYSEAKGVRQAVWLKNENSSTNPIVVMAESIKGKASSQNESYIVISYKGKNKKDKSNNIIKKINKAYKEFEAKPTTTICLSGEFKTRLSKKRINKVTKNIIKAVDGKIIDKMGDDQVLSITGYTPRIANSVHYGNFMVNINISFDYDEVQRKTNIFLATPVIPDEY